MDGVEYNQIITSMSKKFSTIVWFATGVCNYKCSYCVPPYNNGTVLPKNYKNIITFIDMVYKKYPEKQIRFIISGGEITLWKDLIPFLKELRVRYPLKVTLLTNGSKPLSWWHDNIDYFNGILASFHYESANENHFTKVCKIINGNGLVHLMLPYNNKELFEKVYSYGVKLSEEAKIYVVPKLLRKDFESEIYEYTIEELKKTEPLNLQYISDKCKDVIAGYVTLKKDGEFVKNVSLADLFYKRQNNLKGWHCYGGIEGYFINIEGDIFNGRCEQNNIGNVNYPKSITLPDGPYTCQHEYCRTKWGLEASSKMNKGVRIWK